MYFSGTKGYKSKTRSLLILGIPEQIGNLVYFSNLSHPFADHTFQIKLFESVKTLQK